MNDVAQANSGALVRQEFGAMEAVERRQETTAAAVAAQAKAMVEARYVMAMRAPRNWDQVRQDLLGECRRPAFAQNKSTLYRKPIGAGIEGLGIRFVEVALRCMKNVLIETTMVFEDDLKEIHRVSVTDLESNITYPMDVRVSRTVERSKPLDDGSYLSMRMNSQNKKVYTVPANDDDLLNKRAAQVSKAIRTLGLRIIPGDLQDEAEEIIRRVRTDRAAQDPSAERKRILDAFGELGVRAEELTEYLGHSIDACSPPELVELRGVYGAIKDGETTWVSTLEERREGRITQPRAKKADAEAKAPGESVDTSTGEVTRDAAKQNESPAPATEQSAQAGAPTGLISTAALRVLRKQLADKELTEAFCKEFNVADPSELPMSKVNDAMTWVSQHSK